MHQNRTVGQINEFRRNSTFFRLYHGIVFGGCVQERIIAVVILPLIADKLCGILVEIVDRCRQCGVLVRQDGDEGIGIFRSLDKDDVRLVHFNCTHKLIAANGAVMPHGKKQHGLLHGAGNHFRYCPVL